ncbi:PepSY domain-containing protein [Ancylobacter oerskovii]|uniref:PepSY domain-containing protein n=1 Tax=Ancylobacter oerskovii TaxID=459519 RepID=A0ABW4YSE8_9HYPH|nr:PepSY domain-containing protein [Ancylobacter oerskovii]MBS7545428.1 PepSY domain-containing protein [Ancylobacter oerskovii]
MASTRLASIRFGRTESGSGHAAFRYAKLGSALLGAALFAGLALPVRAQTPAISIDDALRIVRANGLATVTQLELDGRKWEAEGRDGAGRRMEVDVDAATGKVLRTETR